MPTKGSNMRRSILCFAVIGLLLTLGAATAQDGVKADIRGAIGKVTPGKPGGNILGTVFVEGKVEKGVTGYDKAHIKVTPKTKIEKLDGKDRRKATFADLKIGVKVQVNFTGPVLESYPVQATAGDVLILEAPPAKEK